jgi:hypothetical protein
MSDFHLRLTQGERDFLVEHLQQVLKETLVEEHRTRNLSYREGVVEREELLRDLIAKLNQPAHAGMLP